MKKLFESADYWCKNSNWKDLALVKFCLCSIGIIIGCLMPDTVKKTVLVIAGVVFVFTYIPLMYKYYLSFKKMNREE